MTLISCAYMRLDTKAAKVVCMYDEHVIPRVSKPKACQLLWRHGECPCAEEVID
jgi:hypothetical protein